ncbi:hypothetical protein [Lysinibacillus capsici]|uniref:hypothetical protein n=1 Tax=Lysinibacillus capsici TaxID=2115968 RepID=UPI00247FA58B|nr:hypothetical protein [Lysinibacillus capsici]
MLSVSNLLEVTRYKESYIEQFCMHSSTCSKVIPKFRLSSYLPGKETENDDIEAELFGTHYSFGEGQHRRCAAKRANATNVPVLVNIYKETRKYDLIESLNKKTKFRIDYRESKDMLQECYEQYASLGLTKEQTRYLNENIENNRYIAYIEEVTRQPFENLKVTI